MKTFSINQAILILLFVNIVLPFIAGLIVIVLSKLLKQANKMLKFTIKYYAQIYIVIIIISGLLLLLMFIMSLLYS